MINVFYEPLPDTIPAGGSDYKILTDFRDWLKFGDLLKDDVLKDVEKIDFMRNWFSDIPEVITAEMFAGLRDFYTMSGLASDQPDERKQDGLTRPPTFDWMIDAQYIIADFRRFYNMDLFRIEYLHWWEFFSLMKALPDESQLYRRIDIRSADLSQINDPKRKRAVMEAQMRIAIPFEVDDFSIGAAFR